MCTNSTQRIITYVILVLDNKQIEPVLIIYKIKLENWIIQKKWAYQISQLIGPYFITPIDYRMDI